ncbi:hypothetical protein DD630_05230 [Streptomyces sp. BSE7F]|nr:hypothetical protein DD630_05230 [Streptomyces sp. BSE7F]
MVAVMDEARWSGRLTMKSRSTRSGGRGVDGYGTVVRRRRPRMRRAPQAEGESFRWAEGAQPDSRTMVRRVAITWA